MSETNTLNNAIADIEPKMSIFKAAEFLEVSVQAVHRQLKIKNLVCPKMGNKAYLTHSIAKQLFNIPFKKMVVVVQIVKGGTGKTTSIQNVACCVSTYGAKVLLVDIDPQGNLTDSCNVDVENSPVLIDLITGNADIREAIVPVSQGIDIIGSRIENVMLDSHLMFEKRPLHTLFSDLLAPIRDNYDYIFIDCPPTLGHSVTAASLYADLLVSPLNPDKFSVKGLKILKQEIANIKKHYKKDVNYKIFLNKYSGITTLSDKTVTTVFSDPDMEGKTLDTAVKFLQEIPNTTDSNRNLFSNLKKSAAKDDFDRLTRELLGISPNTQRLKGVTHKTDRALVGA